MTNATMSRRRLTAQQKQEAVALCLQEDLTSIVVAQRFGLPLSSLARWLWKRRIDQGSTSPRDQGLLNSVERAELNRLRMKTGSSVGRRICFGWRRHTLRKSSCRRKVSLDR